jgi:putative chitinase
MLIVRLFITVSLICTPFMTFASHLLPVGTKMPLTEQQMEDLCPRAKPGWIDSLEDAPFDDFEINTKLRYDHFMAQMLMETGGLDEIVEAHGDNTYCQRYEGRRDLGNTHPGDGCKYRAYGPVLTGRDDYTRMNELLTNYLGYDVDLIDHPERAGDPQYGWIICMLYWKSHNLNKYADQDDIRTITYRINGGYNGFSDRVQWYSRIKRIDTQGWSNSSDS